MSPPLSRSRRSVEWAEELPCYLPIQCITGKDIMQPMLGGEVIYVGGRNQCMKLLLEKHEKANSKKPEAQTRYVVQSHDSSAGQRSSLHIVWSVSRSPGRSFHQEKDPVNPLASDERPRRMRWLQRIRQQSSNWLLRLTGERVRAWDGGRFSRAESYSLEAFAGSTGTFDPSL